MATQRNSNGSEPERLHSVRRSLAVLEALAARPAGATPKELGLALGLHLSTCYRLLNTLVSAGYVTRDGDGLFRLGSRVAYLNNGYLAALHTPPESLPFVHALQDATGETTILSRLEGVDVVSVVVVTGSRPGAVLQGYAGMAAPAYAYAAGRVLLAELPAPHLEAYLAQYADNADAPCAPFPPLDPAALRVELETVRRVGYAMDKWPGPYEVCCLAAPVPTPEGPAETSLTVIVPGARFRQEEPTLVQVVPTVARAIGSVQAAMPAREPGHAARGEGAAAAEATLAAAMTEISEAMSRLG